MGSRYAAHVLCLVYYGKADYVLSIFGQGGCLASSVKTGILVCGGVVDGAAVSTCALLDTRRATWKRFEWNMVIASEFLISRRALLLRTVRTPCRSLRPLRRQSVTQ